MSCNHYVLFYLKCMDNIKYFDNGDKNMTFVTDNEKVYDKNTKYGK